MRTARERLYRTVATSSLRRPVVEAFHSAYYHGETWLGRTHWMGHQIQKCPLDLWQYQEIIHEHRPDLVVETGTAHGGSALYLAHVMDILGHGRIITVDVAAQPGPPEHERITYVAGSSTAPDVVAELRRAAEAAETVMVILDSDHSARHVRDELEHLALLVTPGCYLVVEDSNVNGHPVDTEHGPGPMEALNDWLATGPPFEVDPDRERFLMTFNPRGYLRRTG